jgi:hypothetical protein
MVFEINVAVLMFLTPKYKASDSKTTFGSRNFHVISNNYLLHREIFFMKRIATEFGKKCYCTLGIIAVFTTVY